MGPAQQMYTGVFYRLFDKKDYGPDDPTQRSRSLDSADKIYSQAELKG